MQSKFSSVTAVIPCFNCATTIERAVTSIANQTLLPESVVLIDDCSTDTTKDIIRTLANRHRDGWIKLIELERNSGAATARNAGWNASTTEYVAFLDSDDSWHPKKIEIQYSYMEADKSIMLSGHAAAKVQGGATPNYEVESSPAIELVSDARILRGNMFPTRSVMINASINLRFEEGKRYSEDYLLWARIILKGYKAAFIHSSLAFSYKAHFGATGLSANLWAMEKGELDTLKLLNKENLLNSKTHALLIVWSLFKYIRRVLIA